MSILRKCEFVWYWYPKSAGCYIIDISYRFIPCIGYNESNWSCFMVPPGIGEWDCD